MSTIDAILSMLEAMPESPFEPVSAEQINADLAGSRQQIADGNVRSMTELWMKWRKNAANGSLGI